MVFIQKLKNLSSFFYSLPPTIYPIFTSIMLILSYPKFNLSFLAFFAFAPMTVAFWKSKNLKQSLLCGFIAGFIFYFGILYWIYFTLRAAQVQYIFSILAWILLSSILAVEWLVFALFGFYFKILLLKPRVNMGKLLRSAKAMPKWTPTKTAETLDMEASLAYPFVMASSWVVIEYVKIIISEKLVWFPWFMLGYTQWNNPTMIQIVSITGIYGLSFVLVFCGISLGILFLYKTKITVCEDKGNHSMVSHWSGCFGSGDYGLPLLNKKGDKIIKIFPALAMVLFILGFGIYEIKKSENFKIKTNITFSILQPNIDWYKKWDEKYAQWIKTRIEELVEKTISFKPDAVIWPESSLPGWIDQPALKKWLNHLAAKSGRFHIVGSVSMGKGKHVSSFFMDSSGKIQDVYNKRKLVPFGEYVPLRNILGKYIKVIGELGEFEEGEENQKLFKLNKIKIANFICYESIFPYLFYTDAQKDADLFVNITNDGWYLNTAATYQHFIVNIFRAVENRKPLVRAANTGISGVIDPLGRVIAKTNLNVYGILNVQVPIYNDIRNTFYSKHKNWFAIICLIIVSVQSLRLLFQFYFKYL